MVKSGAENVQELRHNWRKRKGLRYTAWLLVWLSRLILHDRVEGITEGEETGTRAILCQAFEKLHLFDHFRQQNKLNSGYLDVGQPLLLCRLLEKNLMLSSQLCDDIYALLENRDALLDNKVSILTSALKNYSHTEIRVHRCSKLRFSWQQYFIPNWLRHSHCMQGLYLFRYRKRTPCANLCWFYFRYRSS